jgi:hypothetical protein
MEETTPHRTHGTEELAHFLLASDLLKGLIREKPMSVKSTDLLAKNLHLFKKMKDLAARQNALLSEEHMDMFFNLASQREHIRHEIGANEEKYGALCAKSHDEDMGEQTRSLRTQIADVLQSIKELDRKTEEFFLQKREALFSEIRDLRKGQRAMKGYGAKSPRGSRFVDRQG